MDFIISTYHVPTEISLWFQCGFNYAFLPFIPLELRIFWAAVETVYAAFSLWTTSPWCYSLIAPFSLSKFVTIDRRGISRFYLLVRFCIFVFWSFRQNCRAFMLLFFFYILCVARTNLNIIIYFLSFFRRLHVEIRSARVSSSPSLGFLCILYSFMSSSETESGAKNKMRT